MAETFEFVQANSGTGGAKFGTQRYTIGADQVEFPVTVLGQFIDESTVPVAARGDATNGLDVDVTRLPALPAGTNNIGDVDVLTLPAATNAGATAKTADLDTGAGTDTVTLFGLALPASGGAVAGGTSTNPVRTDPTGTTAQPVTDNGGSLTVDGAVAATQSGAWTVQPGNTPNTTPWLTSIHDGTTLATVRNLASNDALNVAIVDASGNQVTSFGGGGGGTEYTEDAAAAADPVGGTLLMVRDDARAGSLTSANGDNVAVRGTNAGELYVKHVDAIPITDNGGSLTVDGTVTANAGTGPWPVTDNGGSLTVDGTVGVSGTVTISGTVTANAGTNLNTSALALEAGGNLAASAVSLGVMDDWDEADRAKVNPIAGQAGVQGGSGVVSANTQRVVLATDVALPAGTNNIGDVDVLTLPASTRTLVRVAGTVASSGNNTLVAAPGAGVGIRVVSYALQARGSVTCQLTDGAGGSALTMPWQWEAREGAYAQPTVIPQYHFRCTNNTALVLNLSAAITVGYEITYWVE